jgi:hypothetical protein
LFSMASFVTSAHILLPVISVAPHESGTRNTLLHVRKSMTKYH